MPAVVGLFIIMALWLTYLTHRLRQQSLENKKSEKLRKYYINKKLSEINAILNGKSKKTGEDQGDKP